MGVLADMERMFQDNIGKMDFNEIWTGLVSDWEEYLEPYGVILPAVGTTKYYWLIYLYYYLGKDVPKDDIALFTYSCMGGECALDQQVRHLIADGWYLLGHHDRYEGHSSSNYMLASTTEPHPDINPGRRYTTLSGAKFEVVKSRYMTGDGHYYCATCDHFGRTTVEGEPIPHYSFRLCKLQQGHMDPSKPLSIDNCIPQCQICNQSARDRFKFDEYGTPFYIDTGEEAEDWWNR